MTSSLKSIFTKYSFNKNNNNNSNVKISSLKSNNNHNNVNFDPEGGVVALTAPADKHAVATSTPHEHSSPQPAGIKCYSQTSNDSAFSSMGCNLVDPCGVYDGDSITSLDQDGSISDGDVNKTSLNSSANCTKSHENLFDRKELFAGSILIEESPSNSNDSKLNGSHKESINSSIISIFDQTSKQCNSLLENSQTSSWMSKLTNASANLTTSSRLSLTRSTSYDTSNSNEQTEKAASLDYDDDKSKRGFRERLKKMSRNRIQPGSTKEKSKQEKHDKLVVTSSRLDISPKNYNQSVPVMELSRREVCARLPFVIAPDTDFELVQADPFLNEKLKKQFLARDDDIKSNYFCLIQPITRTKDHMEFSEKIYQKCVLRGVANMKGNKLCHLFLFQEFLLIAKQNRLAQTFKLKYKIDLSIMWLTEKEVESSFEGGSQSEQSTLLIGWPTEGNVCNLFAHFSPTEKQKWFDAINRQRSKITDRNKDVVIIKLHYEDKTSGKRTKKLAVSRNDSIDDVFQKIPKEFLPNADNECKYHVCIKYVDGDTRPLTGHESLYCIQLASDLLLVSTKVEHFSIIRSKGNVRAGTAKKTRRSRKHQQAHPCVDLNDQHVDSVIHSRKQSSQLFGCALHQLCSSNNNNLPKIIMKLLEHLYKIGPLTEGIFRVCYNYKELQTMISSLDTKLTKNDLNEEASNAINADSDVIKNMPVHMTAALFKCWLIRMPECLLVSANYFRWLELACVNDRDEKISRTKRLISELPPSHLTLLNYLMCVLHRINVNSQINLMTSRNLSVCLSPSILRPSNSVGLSVEAKTIQQANNVVEWLIDSAVEVLGRKECIELFEEVAGHLHGLTEVCGEDSQEGFCTPLPRINTSFLNLKELEDFGKKLTRSNSCEQLDSKYLLPPTPSNFSNNIRASSLDNLDTRGVSQLKKTISPDSGISGSTDESDRKLIESPIFKKEKSLDDTVVQASDGLNRTKQEDDEVQISRCESETSEENDLDMPRIKSFYLNPNSKTRSVADESNVKEVTDDDSKLSDGMIDIDDDEYFLVEKDLNDLHGGGKKSADISDRRGSQLTSEKKSESSAINKYDTAKDTDNTMTKSSSFLTGVSLSRNTSIVECNSADTEVSIEDKFDEIERFFYSEPANSTPTDTKLFRNMTESKIIFDKILFPAEEIKSYDENTNSKFKFQPKRTLETLPQQNKQSPQGEPIQQKPSPKIELKLPELRANGIRKLSPTTNQLYQEQPIHRQPQNHQAEVEPQTPAKLRPLTPNSPHQKLQRQQALERLDVSQNSGGSCLVSSFANVPLPSEASSSSLQAVHSSGDPFKCQNLRQLKQLQFSQQQHNQQQHQLHQQQHSQQPQQQQQPNQQRQSLLSLIESSHHRLVKSVSSNPGTVAANRNDKVQPGRYHTSMHIDNINNILNSNITNNAISSDNNTNSNRNISSIYGNQNIGNRDKINKYISSININSVTNNDDARCSSVSSDINYNRINNFYNINDNSYNTLNSGRRAKSPYIVEIDTGTPTKSLNELKLAQRKLVPSHAADRNDSFQKQFDRKALVLSGNRQLNKRFVNSDPSFMERWSASRPDQASFRNQDNGNGVGGVVMISMEGGARKKFFRTSIQLGSFDTDYITYHDDIPVDDCSVQYRNQLQLQPYHPQLQQQPPAKVLHPQPNSRVSQISHYVEDHRATPTFVNINNSLKNNNKLNNNNNTSYNNSQSFQVVNCQTAVNSRAKPPRTPNQIFTNDMKLFFSSEHEGVISGKRNDNSSMQLKRSGLWKSTFNL